MRKRKVMVNVEEETYLKLEKLQKSGGFKSMTALVRSILIEVIEDEEWEK